jgi:hypothetical protein
VVGSAINAAAMRARTICWWFITSSLYIVASE